jgi:hypothetical protein
MPFNCQTRQGKGREEKGREGRRREEKGEERGDDNNSALHSSHLFVGATS